MDFVPTLCALGTVGICPAGLALGCEEPDPIPKLASRKRKVLGPGNPSRSFSTPLMRGDHYLLPHASRSEPPEFEPNHDQSRASTSYGRSLRPAFWRRASGSSSLFQNSTPSVSRQNSVGPRRSLMSKADHDASPSIESNDFDNLKRSSWLKRISAISSLSGSPSSSIRPTTPSVSFSNNSATPFLVGGGPSPLPPNKLVKRTSSQRVLSSSQAKVPSLRRPATSHQRSATFSQIMTEELSLHDTTPVDLQLSEPRDSAGDPPAWRPYFSSGYKKSFASQPRKRHTSGSTGSDNIRPVQRMSNRHPVLVSATSVEIRPWEDDVDDVGGRPVYNNHVVRSDHSQDVHESQRMKMTHISKKKYRSRHSFSVGDMFASSSPTTADLLDAGSKPNDLQRRRNMTDPRQGRSDANRPDPTTTSHLSPISNVSTFEFDLPQGTPGFPNYSNFGTPSEPSSASRLPSSSGAMPSNRIKRVSLAPSDPASTAFGSDYEQRVFSSEDEDSIDFQSDTAYDSLATRATASSTSGLRGPCIETIFDESPPPETSKDLLNFRELINERRLEGLAINMEQHHKMPVVGSVVQEQPSDSSSPAQPSSVTKEENYDHDVEKADDFNDGLYHVSTPVRRQRFDEDEFTATPMPKRRGREHFDVSSSPSSLHRDLELRSKEDIHMSIEAMSIGDESEWDQHANQDQAFDEYMSLPDFPRNTLRRTTPLPFRVHQNSVKDENVDSMDWHADQRLSIFDWSEQQKSDRDQLDGSGPRPKTVHGKQTLENRGSRSTGRRGPSALHLRSQSVPVARESITESDTHFQATKFGTWGLGNKGVSEEWNDDFDFDDLDSVDNADVGGLPLNTGPPQGMKVPQSIIDRQASVHGQFSQVQEFMLLVEELKRLRVLGAALQLLQGQSTHLWEDAENIINLATLNDDDDVHPPQSPASPSAFDDFDDHSPPYSRMQKLSDVDSDENGYSESVPRRSISSAATPPNGRARGESLAQAKSFLQTIQLSRTGPESSPAEIEIYQQKKLPFDTQDLRELVGRASSVTRALKDIVRKAEGVSVSPDKTPKKFSDPAFSQIFHRIEDSPSPSLKKPGLPQSRSAHGYLGSSMNGNRSPQTEVSGHMTMMTVV